MDGERKGQDRRDERKRERHTTQGGADTDTAGTQVYNSHTWRRSRKQAKTEAKRLSE